MRTSERKVRVGALGTLASGRMRHRRIGGQPSRPLSYRFTKKLIPESPYKSRMTMSNLGALCLNTHLYKVCELVCGAFLKYNSSVNSNVYRSVFHKEASKIHNGRLKKNMQTSMSRLIVEDLSER